MESIIILKANLKRHKGSLVGIFVLMLTLFATVFAVLTVWNNSSRYINEEISRAGFGEMTAWVSGLSDPAVLADEIEGLPEVKQVDTQSIIYSDYQINGQESDSEGQLITVLPEGDRYRFFLNDLSGYADKAPEIRPGEIYVSPSLISMFGVRIGDEISFAIARQGNHALFTVKGYYEDPFMGSSMIGMKGFLICEADRIKLLQTIGRSGIGALARDGAMLHIFQEEGSQIKVSELSGLLNGSTGLSQYTEFVHSNYAISGFMMILQNAFCGLLLAFSVVLLAAVLVVMGHSLQASIDADFVNMGILKTLGFTGQKLRLIWLGGYLGVSMLGMIAGLVFSIPLSELLSKATLTTSGVLIPTVLPLAWCGLFSGVIFLLLTIFITGKARPIDRITPLRAIGGEKGGIQTIPKKTIPVGSRGLYLRLAFRQLHTGRRNYISVGLVAVMLVFFASLVGRMGAWLGPDGKGMMDAFNPADHDIGIQAVGNLTAQEVEHTVLRYTDIQDSYLLAMEGVSVNGVDYTANVISEPERFHLLQGDSCINDNEIVVTESVAADMGIVIGDSLIVQSSGGAAEYRVSGIYQCANDMGANIGMSWEGYLKIRADDPGIWCHHYFLKDPAQKSVITSALETAYGGDVHVHENTWPGLFGIISAMKALMVFLYGMVFVFILVVTALTGSKLLRAEQKDLGIYKALGFQTERLKLTFALRFGVMALAGSAVGTIAAAFLTDPLVSAVMKLAGISNFKSVPGAADILLPAVVVTGLFTCFSYLAAGRMKRIDLTVLMAE